MSLEAASVHSQRNLSPWWGFVNFYLGGQKDNQFIVGFVKIYQEKHQNNDVKLFHTHSNAKVLAVSVILYFIDLKQPMDWRNNFVQLRHGSKVDWPHSYRNIFICCSNPISFNHICSLPNLCTLYTGHKRRTMEKQYCTSHTQRRTSLLARAHILTTFCIIAGRAQWKNASILFSMKLLFSRYTELQELFMLSECVRKYYKWIDQFIYVNL